MSERGERHRRHNRNLRRRVWAKTRGLCWVCRLAVSLAAMSMDHVIPKSKGGARRYENLMPAHKKCNGDRGSKDPPPEAVHPLARVKIPVGQRRRPPTGELEDGRIVLQKRDEERSRST